MGLLWRRRRELHPDQIRAIEGLDPAGRYLLVGPPGSGKTSILLHRGQYLRLAPNNLVNIRLVTFAKTLREFIAANGDDRFPPNLIQTVRQFVNEIFRTYDTLPPELPSGTPLHEQNRIRAAEALKLLDTGRRITFDALLIDEVQDLSSEEITLFSRLTERLMMVGDNRQRLFEANGGMQAARELMTEQIELRHHFRISRDICKVADAILLPGDYRLEEYQHYQGPTPSLPIVRGELDRNQQIEELLQALDVQMDSYNDPEDLLGVVTWRQDDCNALYDALADAGYDETLGVFHSQIQNRRFLPGRRICILTVQSCKGLEFRALHWLFADRNAGLITRERAYTVVTRAKSSLAVYHGGNLPAFISGAIPPPARGLFEDDSA